MRLALLGATGGTVLKMMRQAIERGHSVTAFVRSPERLVVGSRRGSSQLLRSGQQGLFLSHISERRCPMTRRMCFGLLLAMFPLPGLARPKLGDEEWMLRFRSFVKLFNAFVESLNDGRFDFSTWQRMRAAWTKLEME